MENSNQKRFKKMYETLLYKIKEKDPNFSDYNSLLVFCNVCRSYNVDDFNEFRKNYRNNENKTLIDLYSKQYSHVPESERMAYITKMIYNNIIENGFAYHIANINDFESFKRNGISPGSGTNEMVSILARLPKEKRYLITPFSSDYIDEKGNPLKRFCYSTDLNLGRRYGKKPEWLIELGSNIKNEQYWKEQTRGLDGKLVQDLENLYKKYNKKYEKENGRLIVMFPLYKVFPERMLERLKTCNADQLIAVITRIPDGKAVTFVNKNGDGSYEETSHIDSSELIFFDTTKKEIELGTEMSMEKENGGLTLHEIGQKTGRDVLRNQDDAREVISRLGKDIRMFGEDDCRS